MVDSLFEKDFATGEEIAINFGRLVIGDGHIVRLMFCPDGKMRIAIDQGALDDKSVLVLKDLEIGVAMEEE